LPSASSAGLVVAHKVPAVSFSARQRAFGTFAGRRPPLHGRVDVRRLCRAQRGPL